MKHPATAPQTVDEYIAGFPANVRPTLKRIRATIRKAAPKAEESISYRIAAFSQEGPLIYFAAFAKHIGLYPAPCDAPEFKEALAPYRSTRSTARFPIGEKVPYALIARVVRYRLKENLSRAAERKTARKARGKSGAARPRKVSKSRP